MERSLQRTVRSDVHAGRRRRAGSACRGCALSAGESDDVADGVHMRLSSRKLRLSMPGRLNASREDWRHGTDRQRHRTPHRCSPPTSWSSASARAARPPPTRSPTPAARHPGRAVREHVRRHLPQRRAACPPRCWSTTRDAKRAEDDAQEFFASSVAGVRALTTAFRAGQLRRARRQGHRHRHHRRRAVRRRPHRRRSARATDRITVTAPTILINTGSEPVVPDIPGLADQHAPRQQHRPHPGGQPAGPSGRHRGRLPRASSSPRSTSTSAPRSRCWRRRTGCWAARTRTSPQAVTDILASDGIRLVTGADRRRCP